MLLYLTYTCYEEGLVNSFVDPIVRTRRKNNLNFWVGLRHAHQDFAKIDHLGGSNIE